MLGRNSDPDCCQRNSRPQFGPALPVVASQLRNFGAPHSALGGCPLDSSPSVAPATGQPQNPNPQGLPTVIRPIAPLPPHSAPNPQAPDTTAEMPPLPPAAGPMAPPCNSGRNPETKAPLPSHTRAVELGNGHEPAGFCHRTPHPTGRPHGGAGDQKERLL